VRARVCRVSKKYRIS